MQILRNMSMPTKKLIFVDLDETLIHSLGMVPFTKSRRDSDPGIESLSKEPKADDKFADTPIKVVVGKDMYHTYTILRPGANYLLFRLREIGHVYMLTRADKYYAQAMNKVFGFAFDEDRIFDREYVNKWKYKNPELPKGNTFLIDDLNDFDNFEKISFINKFGPSKYIKVDPFFGKSGNEFTSSYIQEIIQNITNA
jgi:NLI interacting factor-like phosphatase